MDDTPDDNPMDQCWRSDNATMSLNGSGTSLIRDDTTGVWRGKSDDGSLIERHGKPEDRNESWKVPVFGDDAGEPCDSTAGFASSWCDQNYRWNVDKVINRTGDMMIYNYAIETNKYARNKGTRCAAWAFVSFSRTNAEQQHLLTPWPALMMSESWHSWSPQCRRSARP